MITAFNRGDDSWKAFEELRNSLQKSGGRIRRTVGFPGGHVEKEIYWHERAQVWSLLDTEETKNRFWCCFGVQNPNEVPSLDIAVEVNPRLEGTDLLVAGAFARDTQGVVHLCHNGKIGGGKPGVGKAAFFRHYRGDLTEMAYGNRIVSVVDLGSITSPRLPSRLGSFAHEVVRVKRMIADIGHDPHTRETGNMPVKVSQGFVPEFSGFKKPYARGGKTEAQAGHGLVVDALAESLEKLGFAVHNDQLRDLFIFDALRSVAVLFEVKTDVAKNSIYTAVGQLFLNGTIRGSRNSDGPRCPGNTGSEDLYGTGFNRY